MFSTRLLRISYDTKVIPRFLVSVDDCSSPLISDLFVITILGSDLFIDLHHTHGF